MGTHNQTKLQYIEAALLEKKHRSDTLMNYFLIGFYIIGLLLAFYYDTWLIAIGVGSLSLVAYYSAKRLLPNSSLYQYVLSLVLGIFMAQFIYQMHGMFEMHFFAFVGSAILITYQNWKLQIPLAVFVIIHHASFSYLQYIGFDEIYFTQLEFMNLQTFFIHSFLALTIFLLCGLWAHNFLIFTYHHVKQGFEIGKLEESDKQKAKVIAERQRSKSELEKLVSLLETTFNLTDEGILVADKNGKMVLTNKKFAELWNIPQKLLDSRDYEKVLRFILDQLVNPEEYSSKARDFHSLDEVSNDTIYFKDSRIFECYSRPQLSNGESIGRVWGFRDISKQTQDLEERKKMITNITSRNKDLEQFSNIISHNLRSPVANILGFSEALKEDVSEDDRKDFIDAISVSINKLNNVISDLSTILHVKQSKNEGKALVCFSELVNDIKDSINHSLLKEEVLFDIDFSAIDELLTLKNYMYSVFYNLISNSIKYKRPGITTTINISSQKNEKSVYLIFKDNGLGIDLEKIGDQVFGLYKRFHLDVAEGRGLGLYLTKTHVESLGGQISIVSEVNKGTEIKIKLDC